MRNRYLVWLLLIASISLLLSGCTGGKLGKERTSQSAEEIKQMVNDFSTDKLSAEGASITSHQLIVTSLDQSKTTYELPKDEFFVSIAPYINETHPCAIHSLTGCQGEMSSESFEVKVTDQDGNVIIDDTLQAHNNGFIDIWLPRDRKYEVEIGHGDKSGKEEISTFEGDNTCISTMQLS
ncbi:CueP family metal-binding protein [Paenibacillus antibioticophila]|uniref:CueP family metal-binding protein n=1 Tax=Paenibacillus antibioticophila TaxID=1274374 RepID=UPI0005CA57CA|nr:CueP family metal-binding protein [Paenibacillus antibioticophila]